MTTGGPSSDQIIESPALSRLTGRDEHPEEVLIDDIYQAALVPELWPTVLGGLSSAVDGAGGLLFTSHLDRIQWVGSPDIYDLFVEFLQDGWAAINPRPARIASHNHPGFICEDDCFTPEELDADPVYRFLRSHNLGWAAGTMINVPSGDSIIFSFERAYDKGPIQSEVIQLFDRMRPHLARAALMASRLGLERARVMATTLESVGLPAAILRADGRVSAVNASLNRMMPDIAQDRRERFTLTDHVADRLFASALAGLERRAGRRATQSIPLAACEGRPPMIVHVLPVRGAAHDIFSQASGIVVITPVDRAKVPTAEVLQGLFDLTPAEARAARAIAQGMTVAEIAASGKVTSETVRTHVKAILAKTGLSRQADLVALLAGAALRAPTSK